jgi:hypothetical protein
VVFSVCHAVGDFVLQTDWQATHKAGGLGRSAESRRALAAHGCSYIAAYVPALVWLSRDLSALGVLAVAVAIIVPHVLQDDARALNAYARGVKGLDPVAAPLPLLLLDQSLHLVMLFALALLVGH